MNDTVRIGLTGATGVLGRSVRQYWPGAEWVPFTGDVRDVAALRTWATSASDLTAVMHFAAIVPLADVERDPLSAFEVNVRGTWNVMEVVRDRAPWVFVASSSHTYIPEKSLYGATKLLAEQAALAYARLCSVPVCVGRIFSFSAPSQPESYLMPSLVRRIRHAEKDGLLEIRGGHNERDFLTTRRIASAIRTLFEHRATGTFDIGSGEGVTILEVARRLAVRLGREDIDVETPDGERSSLVADIAKIRDLGWDPGDALDELLTEMSEEPH